MKKTLLWIIGIVVVVLIVVSVAGKKQTENQTIKIGFISDLTGSVAKYGAYEAGKLAMEKINANGGIKGKPLEIIFEDGKCNGPTAVSAMQKLISVDKVKVVLGGHCSPESLAIAPIAEQNKIAMLASISTTPGLTNAGEYVFRTSPVSTVQSGILAKYINSLGLKNVAIIHEQTDYARPIAEGLKKELESDGGKVSVFETFNPGISDYRTILSKIKLAKPDAIFLSPQNPDAGLNLVKQIKELGISARLFGNDVLANMINIQKEPTLFEGMVLAQPDFDENSSSLTKKFINDYNSRFNTTAIPYGIWTAESYDAVYIVADAIVKNGNTSEGVKSYLENLKDYNGASGKINFDSNGDGVRDYILRIIKNGKIEKVR